MNLNATLHIRGDLGITVTDSATGAKTRYQIRNMIMNSGLVAVLQLLAQKTTDPVATTLLMKGLRVGTDNTPPVNTQTNLIVPVYTVVLADGNKTETVSGTYELKITATLPNGTGGDPFNGVTLREAGLVLGSTVTTAGTGGTLFSRQIHPGITKNTANVVEYDWRISLTA